MIAAIVRFFSDYVRILMLFGAYMLYSLYRNYQLNLQPFPGENDPDGPYAIKSLTDWNNLLRDNRDKNIVVDFYATWCPPCRTVAPIFNRMAKEPKYAPDSKSPALFSKCNVDKAADVARSCRVSAMPTFKVFRNEKEAFSMTGWSEGKLRSALAPAKRPAGGDANV